METLASVLVGLGLVCGVALLALVVWNVTHARQTRERLAAGESYPVWRERAIWLLGVGVGATIAAQSFLRLPLEPHRSVELWLQGVLGILLVVFFAGLSLLNSRERRRAYGFTRPRSPGQSEADLPPAHREEIETLLRSGNRLAAIKMYRQHTGAGLREAVDAVEGLRREDT